MAALSPAVSDQIRSRFLSLDVSVDELLVHPDDAKAFADAISSEVLSVADVDVPSILRELIRLRKIGEARGGLPRRVRQYRGRGPRPR